MDLHLIRHARIATRCVALLVAPASFGAPTASAATLTRASVWTARDMARLYASAAATVAGWINSPGHRANIDNGALRFVGFGVASSDPSSQGRHMVQRPRAAGAVGRPPQ
jgi:hypothetical protein